MVHILVVEDDEKLNRIVEDSRLDGRPMARRVADPAVSG